MKQLFTFIYKEFLHVFRDKKSMLLLFGLPIVLVILFGYALSNEIKNARVVVCDYAQDYMSKEIIQKIEASPYFVIEQSTMSYQEIDEIFKEGKMRLAIIFPTNFADNVFHTKEGQIQVIADASDPNAATTLTNYLNAILIDYQRQMQNAQNIPLQINIESRMIYNPELRGVLSFVPGLMAFILLLVNILMTSISIVKEKENGTMEILLVSPFNPFMVIVAKLFPYLILSILNLTVILILSYFLFDITVQGNLFLLYAVSVLYILTCLSIGLFISNTTNSQQEAMMSSLVGMMVPGMILTGFMFPIENMPYALQIAADFMPSKWYFVIVKDIMIKGLGFTALWKEIGVLFGMFTILMLVNVKIFKIRLE